MKNSQEPNDVKITESPIIPKDKQDEPKELSSNSKDINNLNSGLLKYCIPLLTAGKKRNITK